VVSGALSCGERDGVRGNISKKGKG